MTSGLLVAIAAALLGSAWLGLAVDRWLRRARARRHGRRRSRRALRGEHDAEPLLVAHGYQILDRQPRTTYAIGCDGEAVEIELRADLLVERDGRRLIAEVKTGEQAPSLGHAATRRQLLEYRVAYPVEGVVLVDVEGGELHEIDFPLASLGPPTAPSPGKLSLAATGVAALLGFVLGLGLARWW